MRRLVAIALPWIAIALAGCGDSRPPMAGAGVTVDEPSGSAPIAPPKDAGVDTSEPVTIEDGYPSGTPLLRNGGLFPALTFEGYDDGGATWSTLDMRSYFDADGAKGINAVVLIVAAQWCAVCQQEARWVPGEYLKTWKARGTRVLTVMIEDVDHHQAAKAVADAWRDTFAIPYAIGIDPLHRVVPPDFGAIKLPITYVIDPRTMKIEKIYSDAITPPTIPALDTVLARNGG
jgi:hypothetical protein